MTTNLILRLNKCLNVQFFSSKNIMNKKENKLASTEVVKSMQVADLLILPHYFVIIDKN